MARILKPGGTFLMCNESDSTDEMAKKFEGIIGGIKCYTIEEIEAALEAAGFRELKRKRHPSKPWITVPALSMKTMFLKNLIESLVLWACYVLYMAVSAG